MRAGRYVIFGLLLIVVAAALLFWNEGRAVGSADALAEGASRVESIDAVAVEPRNEAKLVHLSGNTTSAPLHDPDMGIVTAGLRLNRKVEMFQWKEAGNGRGSASASASESNFTYTREWSAEPIDWTHFRFPQDHRNPPMPSLASAEFVADDVKIGAFQLTPRIISLVGPGEPFNAAPAAVDQARARLNQPSQLIQGGVFVGGEPAAPRVGDIRITYLLLPHQSVTIVGRQTGAGISPYQASNGNEILLVQPGQKDASEMFRSAADENTVLTWVLRIVGVLMIYLAWRTILRPVQIMGSHLRFLDTAGTSALRAISVMLTLVLAPCIIGVAWLAQRPLLGLAALAAAVFAGGLVVTRLRAARPTAAVERSSNAHNAMRPR